MCLGGQRGDVILSIARDGALLRLFGDRRVDGLRGELFCCDRRYALDSEHVDFAQGLEMFRIQEAQAYDQVGDCSKAGGDLEGPGSKLHSCQDAGSCLAVVGALELLSATAQGSQLWEEDGVTARGLPYLSNLSKSFHHETVVLTPDVARFADHPKVVYSAQASHQPGPAPTEFDLGQGFCHSLDHICEDMVLNRWVQASYLVEVLQIYQCDHVLGSVGPVNTVPALLVSQAHVARLQEVVFRDDLAIHAEADHWEHLQERFWPVQAGEELDILALKKVEALGLFLECLLWEQVGVVGGSQ